MVVLPDKKILTSTNIEINRLFPERYFSQSWAFDFCSTAHPFSQSLTSGKKRKRIFATVAKIKRSDINRFIAILACVRKFWWVNVRVNRLKRGHVTFNILVLLSYI